MPRLQSLSFCEDRAFFTNNILEIGLIGIVLSYYKDSYGSMIVIQPEYKVEQTQWDNLSL